MITNEIVFMLGYVTKKQWASALRMDTGLNKEIFRELLRKVEKAYHVELMKDVEKIVMEETAARKKIEEKWKK